MSAERCTIRDDLTGKLYRGSSKKVIIFCHGYRSSSKHPALLTLCKGLYRQGHSTFTFDFSGKNPLDIPGQVEDIHAVLSYLKKEYDEIILLAGSFGGLPAAIAASQVNVDGLIVINGFFGFTRLGRKYQSKYLLFRLLTFVAPAQKAVWSYYRKAFKPAEIAAPVLVLHAVNDAVVPLVQSKRFFEALRSPKKFIGLTTADHHLSSSTYTDEVLEKITEWLGHNEK